MIKRNTDLNSNGKTEMEREIATKYCIDQSVAKVLLKQFGSVEDMVHASRYGILNEPKKKFIRENVLKLVDVNLDPNSKNFGFLIKSIYGIDTASDVDFKLFSSDLIRETLTTLTPREEKILKIRFGLNSGETKNLKETGDEFSITRERVNQIEAKALRKLRHPERMKQMGFTGIYNINDQLPYTAEEKSTISNCENIIFNSPLIFSRKDSSVIATEELENLGSVISELLFTKSTALSRVNGNYNANVYSLETKVEDLGLSCRAFNCLKRANINCVADIKPLSLEEISSIRNMGMKTAEEVFYKVKSIFTEEDEAIIEDSALEQEEKEEIKEVKQPSLAILFQKRKELVEFREKTFERLSMVETAIVALDKEIGSAYQNNESTDYER